MFLYCGQIKHFPNKTLVLVLDIYLYFGLRICGVCDTTLPLYTILISITWKSNGILLVHVIIINQLRHLTILVEHGQIMANWQWLQTLHQLRQSQRARTWKPESRNSGPDRNTPKNQWLIIIYPLEDRVITLSKQHVQTHPDGLMYVWNQDPKMISYLVSSGYLMYRWKITHLEMNMTM